MKKLTLETLTAAHACTSQVDLFRSLFGAETEVTLEICLAHASEFEWSWAATCLLTAEARPEYERAIAAAWAERDRAIAAARAEYKRAIAAARAERDRAMARSFARAYNS